MESQNPQPNPWQQSQPQGQPPQAPPAAFPNAPPPRRSPLLPIGILVVVIILIGGIALLYNHGTSAPKQQNATPQHSTPPQSGYYNTSTQNSTPSNSASKSPPEFLPESQAVQILGQQGNYSTEAITNQTEINTTLSLMGFKGNATVNAFYIMHLNSTTNSSVKLLVGKIVSPDSSKIYADYLNSSSYGGGMVSTYKGLSYSVSSLAAVTGLVGYAGNSFIETYVLGNPNLNQTMLLSILANYTGAASAAQPAQNVTLTECTSLNLSVTAPNSSSSGTCSWSGGNLTLISNFAPSSYGEYSLLGGTGRLISFATLPLNSSTCVSTESLGYLPNGNYILRLSLTKLNESCGTTYLKLESG